MSKELSALARSKPLEVDVELSDPVPTDEQIEADLKGLMNLTAVNAATITSLKRVGVHVKRQGILETQRGTVYVTQAWVLGASQQVARILQAKAAFKEDGGKDVDADEICKLADCLGKLAGKQAELSAVMLTHEPNEANAHEPPPAPNQAFPAGAVVFGGNAQAHFHQTPPQKPVVTLPLEP